MQFLRTALVAALIVLFAAGHSLAAGPVVVMETTEGTIMLLLDEEKAPNTVANFMKYVDAGFYDGTIFHRVINGFMIQGGAFDTAMQGKPPLAPPIPNEADNGLANDRGTIAMARTNDPHSAGSQFFINQKDNKFLNFKAKSVQGWGYAVFGRVLRGMDVVDRIAKTPTGNRGGMADVPVTPVVVKRAYRHQG